MDPELREKVLENLKKCNIDKIADSIDPAQTMLRCISLSVFAYVARSCDQCLLWSRGLLEGSSPRISVA